MTFVMLVLLIASEQFFVLKTISVLLYSARTIYVLILVSVHEDIIGCLSPRLSGLNHSSCWADVQCIWPICGLYSLC